MRILALDTATENCSAALLIDGQLHAAEELLDRGHAERILPMVDELLRAAQLRLADLTAIAFGRGPGSFTGVRLAASVTQGLAWGAGLRVVPVSDLRAVAQRALELSAAPPRVLVCNDARMHEVYWACFERSPDGFAMAVTEERVGSPAAVALPAPWRHSPGDGPASVAGAGSGFAAYPQLGASLSAGVTVVRERLLPRAAEIVRLAAVEVANGHLLRPEQALPVYLRDDVARPAVKSS
ncbi:MAG TPA: tRNA (adenosine(37)-N6)-threonylcarbamoyltransferase complex dimerization subunit type 1 TsaB [Steroidobacteraceae bacterium]|nr:tRNA (adenosine(37)-N6)-threonylcarbamoyltransferase complex dimerization subunit type 1 TsaB [Steroidobacteraceae bacterium]